MDALTTAERCAVCKGLLVPPDIPTGFSSPKGTDYVCLRCGRPYRWTGRPPRLTIFVVAERCRDEDEDDDEGLTATTLRCCTTLTASSCMAPSVRRIVVPRRHSSARSREQAADKRRRFVAASTVSLGRPEPKDRARLYLYVR